MLKLLRFSSALVLLVSPFCAESFANLLCNLADSEKVFFQRDSFCGKGKGQGDGGL
jgi:hypothetical protein